MRGGLADETTDEGIPILARQTATGFVIAGLKEREHAYHIDYGAAAAKYVGAFFSSIQWEEVNRRYDRALKASQMLRVVSA